MLALTEELIDRTYPEFGLVYGDKTELKKGVRKLYQQANDAYSKIVLPKDTELVITDWGGIGDGVHVRLAVQHLARNKKVAWVTTPLTAPLYRDDTLCPVFSGFSSSFRDARQVWLYKGLAPAIEALERDTFGCEVRDVSAGVARFWHTGSWKTYADLFMGGAGVSRDPSVKHQLTHHGKDPGLGRYIVLERTSITFGNVPPVVYDGLVRKLKTLGMSVVLVGSKKDEYVPGTVDKRGLDLYSTFSLLAHSMGLVGRASGNQALMAFLPHLPILEVDIPAQASMATVGYGCHIQRCDANSLAKTAYTLYGRYLERVGR